MPRILHPKNGLPVCIHGHMFAVRQTMIMAKLRGLDLNTWSLLRQGRRGYSSAREYPLESSNGAWSEEHHFPAVLLEISRLADEVFISSSFFHPYNVSDYERPEKEQLNM